MPQHSASHLDASESWDDDFDFQSQVAEAEGDGEQHDRQDRPHATASTSQTTRGRVPAEESWDDAYEDDDASHRREEKAATDAEMESWGSASEWSGDAEDLSMSHESASYTRASSEPPEPRSPSSTSHGTRFPTLSHSPFAAASTVAATSNTPRSPTAGSFFARMSPKKWKKRPHEGATAKPPMSQKDASRSNEKHYPAGEEKPTSSCKRGKGGKGKSVPSDAPPEHHPAPSKRVSASHLKRVFSGVNLSSAPRESGAQSSASPLSSTTPGFVFSPSSPEAERDITAAGLKNPSSFDGHIHAAPTLKAIPSTAPPRSSVFATSSAHNLPPGTTPAALVEHAQPPTLRRSSSLHIAGSSLGVSVGNSAHSVGDLRVKPAQLKIPVHISRTQVDIRRDMGDVREFAGCVEQLKNLQRVYAVMLRDLRATLSEVEPPSSSIASTPSTPSHLPVLLALPRPRRPSFSPKKRRGTVATSSPQSSPTKPPSKRKFSLASGSSPSKASISGVLQPLASAVHPSAVGRTLDSHPFDRALDKLDAEYGVWWECAELLIELGGRGEELSDEDHDGGHDAGPALGMTRGRRPRAVTLGSDAAGSMTRPRSISAGTGPPLASPPKAQWRATTGRAAAGHDFTKRQLALLKGMLEARGHGWDPRTAKRESDDGMRQDERAGVHDGSVRGKGKSAALGIRDLWRGLKRGAGGGPGGVLPQGEATPRGSSSGDSSASASVPESPSFARGSKYIKTGSTRIHTTDSTRTPSPSKRTLTAADTAVLTRRKQPTRRPSLAGIFGIGQRPNKLDTDTDVPHSATKHSADDDSSDWDRMDIDRTGTVRALKRLKPKNSFGTHSRIGTSSKNASPAGSGASSKISPPSDAPSSPSSMLSAGLPARVRDSDWSSSPEKQKPPRSPRLFISFTESGASSSGGSPAEAAVPKRKRLFSNPRSSSQSDEAHTLRPSTPLSRAALTHLALTPENIRPLLSHAREVGARLNECIGEVREMMGGMSVV